MGFDIVSYLLGQTSAGGGADVLLNEVKYAKPGSGAIAIDKTVTIPSAGSYFILAIGYATSLSVKINDTAQPLNVSQSQLYRYWYTSVEELSAGDVVAIDIESSGESALAAQIIKT